jgi:tagatose-6-phosphate ketose/aldose isomerase
MTVKLPAADQNKPLTAQLHTSSFPIWNQMRREGAPMQSFTEAEIAQQPEMWRATRQVVAGVRDEVGRLLGEALADPRTRVVLTGAGTSAYAGELLAPDLSRLLKRPVEAVATTDIVADPAALVVDDRPLLLVSFARSGNSPESTAAVKLVSDLADLVYHLVVTCNEDGALSRTEGNAVVVTLPAATNDRGFAMTSSFTSMVLAAWLCFAGDLDVDGLAKAADAALQVERAIAPERIVYLGSGGLKGLAREASLKCLELTAGDVPAFGESSLGFRHGPKAVLTDRTVAVVFASGDPYRRAYDLDIARELVAALPAGQVVVVSGEAGSGAELGATDWHVPREAAWPDALWGLAAVIPAQLTALSSSLATGHTPDNPFPGGQVNRVVQGVEIHDFPGER